MFTAVLFLGFPIDSFFAKKLAALDPAYVSLFIQNNETYLREITYDNVRYLGKVVGNVYELIALDSLEANILSLLKRLVDDYPYEQNSLHLFPLLDNLPTTPYAA